MSFVEIDVFGVYVAPIVAAGLFRWIWHPALFEFSVYLVVLAALVLTVGALKLQI